MTITNTISKLLGRSPDTDTSKRTKLRADCGKCADACAAAKAQCEATAKAHVDAQNATVERQAVFDERGDEASLSALSEARRTQENAQEFADRAKRVEAQRKKHLEAAEHALLEDELEVLNKELSDDALRAIATPLDTREAEVLEDLVAVLSARRGAAQKATHKGNRRVAVMRELGMDVTRGMVANDDGKTSRIVGPPSPTTGIISYRGPIRTAFLNTPGSKAIRDALVSDGLFSSRAN